MFSEPEPIVVPSLILKGPFVAESYAYRHMDEYRSYICELSKCRSITRDVIILTNDMTYEQRDNIRIELGIMHHMHQIEICLREGRASAVGLDHFFLLNDEDRDTLTHYLTAHPLSAVESSICGKMLS